MPTPSSNAGSSIVAETPIAPNAFYSLNTYHGSRKTEEDIEGYQGSYAGASGIAGTTDGKIDVSAPDAKATSSFSNVHSGSFATAEGVNSFGYAGTQALQHNGMTPNLLFGSGNLYRDTTKKNALTGIGYMGTQLNDGNGLAGAYMGAHGSGFRELKHSGIITGGSRFRDGSESNTAVANAQSQTVSTQDDRQTVGLATSEAQSGTLGARATGADVRVQTAVQALGAGLAGSVSNAESEGLITGESKLAASNSYSESYTIGSALAASGSESNATIDGESANSEGPIRNDASSMSNSGFSELNNIASRLPTESMLGDGNSKIMQANSGGVIPGPVVSQQPLGQAQGSQIVGIADGLHTGPSQIIGIHLESNETNPPGDVVSQSIQSPNLKGQRQSLLNVFPYNPPAFINSNYQKMPNLGFSKAPDMSVLKNFGIPNVLPFTTTSYVPSSYQLQYGAAQLGHETYGHSFEMWNNMKAVQQNLFNTNFGSMINIPQWQGTFNPFQQQAAAVNPSSIIPTWLQNSMHPAKEIAPPNPVAQVPSKAKPSKQVDQLALKPKEAPLSTEEVTEQEENPKKLEDSHSKPDEIPADPSVTKAQQPESATKTEQVTENLEPVPAKDHQASEDVQFLPQVPKESISTGEVLEESNADLDEYI